MRARLGLVVAGFLAFGGCGDDDDGTAFGGDRTARAAEALARAMHFTGGELREGAMELASEERVEVILASEQVVTPNRAGIMPLEVDNPIEDDKPQRAALMQFGDVEQHVRVPTKNSVEGEGDLNFEFEIDDGACKGLCAELIDVPVTIALELAGGDISKHLKTQIAIDCREDGDPDACDEPSKGSGRDGGTSNAGRGGSSADRDGSVPVGPVATAAVEALLDAVDDFQNEVCSCIPGTSGAQCVSAGAETRSCEEAVLFAFAAGNEELLGCMQLYFEEQTMCANAAACDGDALATCAAASEDGNNWTAIEEQCGAVPVSIRAGIDSCEGQAAHLFCGDGESYPIDGRCNDYEDCADGSDELGCDGLPPAANRRASRV